MFSNAISIHKTLSEKSTYGKTPCHLSELESCHNMPLNYKILNYFDILMSCLSFRLQIRTAKKFRLTFQY